jgi:hypothetical protein
MKVYLFSSFITIHEIVKENEATFTGPILWYIFEVSVAQ